MIKMTQAFQKVAAIRGMNDLLPGASARWEQFEEIVRGWLRGYGYRNVRTPVLEHTRLFARGIGEVTDIVEKEMYTFTDALNGESLTMRPEMTAGIVRAYNAAAVQSVTGAVDVAAAVRRGEPIAVEVWSTALDRLADGLAALTTVVAPEAIVLGGGLALAGEELLFAPLRSRLAERLHYSPVPDLLPAAFESTGGLVGAALLAVELLETPL